MTINKDTKLYGSFSNNPGNNGCIFFNTEFEKHGINAIYKSFFSNDIQKLMTSVRHLNFSGFALSMPFKTEIVNYTLLASGLSVFLDEIDPTAKEIGAVNTVINNNGVLIGYNTDWIGVKKYFMANNINGHVTILGNGGFSKAVQYACKNMNLTYDIIKRSNWSDITNLKENDIVFNATPIDISSNGMLIDGRPFTEQGKEIANYQAIEQFYLYTSIKL